MQLELEQGLAHIPLSLEISEINDLLFSAQAMQGAFHKASKQREDSFIRSIKLEELQLLRQHVSLHQEFYIANREAYFWRKVQEESRRRIEAFKLYDEQRQSFRYKHKAGHLQRKVNALRLQVEMHKWYQKFLMHRYNLVSDSWDELIEIGSKIDLLNWANSNYVRSHQDSGTELSNS